MRVLVCPDKFKGTLSAAAAARAIARGVRRRFPDAEVIELPLADGGEGSLDVLATTGLFQIRRLEVTGPLRRPVSASYLVDGDHAFLETSLACGLRHVPPPRRDPGATTTIGVGELIEDAVARGARRITLFLGGSATNDGGAGMAGALGFRFFSDRPQDFIPTGSSLRYVRRIDTKEVLPALAGVDFTAAWDVDVPLCGPQGAAFGFAAQKGAQPEDLPLLDAGLRHLADRWARDLYIRTDDLPGAGAAGGLGAGCAAFLGAELRSAGNLLLDLLDFDRLAAAADVIITGEGKLDEQTARGKVVAGVLRRTSAPVLAVCGARELSAAACREIGLEAVASLTECYDERQAFLRAEECLSALIAHLPFPRF